MIFPFKIKPMATKVHHAGTTLLMSPISITTWAIALSYLCVNIENDGDPVSVGQLSDMARMPTSEVIEACMLLSICTIDQDDSENSQANIVEEFDLSANEKEEDRIIKIVFSKTFISICRNYIANNKINMKTLINLPRAIDKAIYCQFATAIAQWQNKPTQSLDICGIAEWEISQLLNDIGMDLQLNEQRQLEIVCAAVARIDDGLVKGGSIKAKILKPIDTIGWSVAIDFKPKKKNGKASHQAGREPLNKQEHRPRPAIPDDIKALAAEKFNLSNIDS